MPIRAENKARYLKDWPAVSARIRERAGNRCECEGACGLRHYVDGQGRQIDLPPSLWIDACPGTRCLAENGKPHPTTESNVVLTVAHLDHMPENCADENLKAWCQRCHNRYDAPMRARGIKERRRASMAVADLFCEPT